MIKKIGLAALCALLFTGCSIQEGKYVLNFSGEAKLERQTENVTEGSKEEETQTEAKQTEEGQSEIVHSTTQQAETISAETVSEAPPMESGSKKALFRDSDGTIHGPQIGVTESGTPLYDYEIEEAQIPDHWREPLAPGVVAAYLSPDGTELYKDADGTIHGAQIGVTESGTPLYDYEFDADLIPVEWKNVQ